MSSRGWVIRAVFGAIGWVWLGLGLAQAGVIPPTDPGTLMLTVSATVTVSLYQDDSTLPAAVSVTLQSPSRCTTSGMVTPNTLYKDVTDCWLPELGKSIFVVINGASNPPLVPPAAGAAFPLAPGAANPFVATLTTSAYPGQCTNFGSDVGPDFTLDSTSTLITTSTGPLQGYKLTPNDCGGMAVIQVGNLKFLLPKDGTVTVAANGLPDVWENLYGGSLNPATDIDTGPAATSPVGDGNSTLDEYRGFIVSGKQIRTDPTQKDLFLHVVNHADAAGGGFYGTYPAPTAPNATLTVPVTAGTLGAIATFTTSSGVFSNAHVRGEIIGNVSGRARIVTVTAPTSVTAEITQAFAPTSLSPGAWQVSESLFALAYTLLAPQRLHVLGYAPIATNPLEPLTNEWIDNFVSLVPAQTLNISDPVPDRIVNTNRLYGPAQKGVRVMEALNINSPSVLGWSFGVASPNQAGNVAVFNQRISDYITGLFAGATTLKYSTASLVNGAWTWSTPILVPDGSSTNAQAGVATNSGVRNFILSKAYQFYTGHEIHHSLDLTPDIQGTTKTTYGHHFAPGTGDCLDQAITTRSQGGTVTFNIPSICGTADQTNFLIQ